MSCPARGKLGENILTAAYELQERKGKSSLFTKEVRMQMLKKEMKVPKQASGLSAAIAGNIKKGYLEHTGKKAGRQKAFRLTERGREHVESGFGK